MENAGINTRERGQSLVLLAVMLIVLFGMLALIIDGGMAYAQRRSAQNAADAGALAGARELCRNSSNTTVEATARTYAENNNGATSSNIVINRSAMTVGVTTHINYNTFIANVLGRPTMDVAASASAGCYKPCEAESVLPVSWACQPPAGVPAGTDACQIYTGTLSSPGPTYIIMDSKKQNSDEEDGDLYCQDPITHLPSGALNCDLDGDHINDIFTGGTRSWLNLSGGSPNTNVLTNWILNPSDVNTLHIHTWYNGITGNKVPGYTAIADLFPDRTTVIIPVFDHICDTGLPATSCSTMYDSEDTTVEGGGTVAYVHIINFSLFRLTCVQKGNQVLASDPSLGLHGNDNCPGVQDFIDLNGYNVHKLKAVEGYFLGGYNSDLSGACGAFDNVGTYTIYLNH